MKFIVPLLKWSARILSLICIGLIAVKFSEKGFDIPASDFQQISLLICFPFGVVLGMIIAWWWEGIGGMITILSFVMLYIFSYIFYEIFPEGSDYARLSSPGVFFILYSLITYNARHRNDYL